MSKRQRTPKVVSEPDELPAGSKPWTHEDKCNLLKGLRTYGHTDLDNISALLPNKTKPAIKLMIHKIMQKSKSVSYNKSPALKTWLESGTFDDKSRPIPQALKYISLFEKHPTPEESGGFDFKAAYDYLHRMTLGLPAIDLPKGTLEKMNTLIEEIRTEVWPASEEEVVGYLGTLGMREPAPKCYPPMTKLNCIKNDCWLPMEEEPTD